MSLAIILFTPDAYALNILETSHPLLSTKTYDVSSAASIKITSNSGTSQYQQQVQSMKQAASPSPLQ
jgi:hypothetical protein